ncbi:hypothetical protein AMAG_03460 [Allomyces macrogynus ATCC 38327]|uniref:Cytochrome c oxidase assembly protein COX20, mitochondrial n=1 Tax=Allomyces macrogynus (strain ATCC 38327) TaxID=578462 RepID=A0A0L0S9J1_ALLM3|nr:hypothetical protein AMAG_03460 [Allomyces macrogynus ATCC 38327]|eukprot:KNE59122.1 hypothetical protein AMAG_03460 [Allomyces macrogynus ATCC 38327]
MSSTSPIGRASPDDPVVTPAPEPGVIDVLKSLKTDDFKKVGEVPCARSALLYGIGTGFGAGALRFAFRGSVLSASNYAVATFCAVSALSWEVCRWQMQRSSIPKTVIVPPGSQHRDE